MTRSRMALEVARATGTAALVELGLRRSGLPRLAQRCGVRLDLSSSSAPAVEATRLPARARRQMQAVDIVMRRWPFGDTCLRRCLVFGQRLRRFEPVLRIGVALDPDGRFRAHSWLEIDGHALDDGDLRQFTVFGQP